MREYNTQLGGDAVAQQDVISCKRTARWTLRVAALLLTVITCLALTTTALHQVVTSLQRAVHTRGRTVLYTYGDSDIVSFRLYASRFSPPSYLIHRMK